MPLRAGGTGATSGLDLQAQSASRRAVAAIALRKFMSSSPALITSASPRRLHTPFARSARLRRREQELQRQHRAGQRARRADQAEDAWLVELRDPERRALVGRD